MLPRKTVILAKIESVYGTDAAPTSLLNAIQCRNLKVTPLKVDVENRQLYQAFLGNSEDVPVLEECLTEFEVEIAGAGTAGQAPKYGPLLRACAHSETLLAADVTGTAQAGAAGSITLAVGASAVNGFYSGMVIDTTGGAGSGQSRIIYDYDGATKIASVDRDWTTPPDATTLYAIRANAQYRPISSAFEAVTLYHYRDAVLYKGLGVRGSVMMDLNAKKIPVYKFKFICLYTPVTDAAVPTDADFTGFKRPRASIPQWVPAMSVHRYAAKVASLSLDEAGDVQHTLWMNAESIEVVDRKPAGKATVEAVTVATKDYFALLQGVTLGPVAMRNGTESGNSIVICGPQVQISQIDETEVNGVMGYNLTTVWKPLRGNDEYAITVM